MNKSTKTIEQKTHKKYSKILELTNIIISMATLAFFLFDIWVLINYLQLQFSPFSFSVVIISIVLLGGALPLVSILLFFLYRSDKNLYNDRLTEVFLKYSFLPIIGIFLWAGIFGRYVHRHMKSFFAGFVTIVATKETEEVKESEVPEKTLSSKRVRAGKISTAIVSIAGVVSTLAGALILGLFFPKHMKVIASGKNQLVYFKAHRTFLNDKLGIPQIEYSFIALNFDIDSKNTTEDVQNIYEDWQDRKIWHLIAREYKPTAVAAPNVNTKEDVKNIDDKTVTIFIFNNKNTKAIYQKLGKFLKDNNISDDVIHIQSNYSERGEETLTIVITPENVRQLPSIVSFMGVFTPWLEKQILTGGA